MRAVVVALALQAMTTTVVAQEIELHGENAVFSTPGITVVWGVLRAPVEEETQVVIRIALAGAAYAYVRVDAVDPFTRSRRPGLLRTAVSGVVDVRDPRTTFGDFPRREIRFYRAAADRRADAPALTIYYLGVPDTTPEFTSEGALLAYFAAAVAKAASPVETSPLRR